MKILITGGAGFIGSNIADALIGAKHKVVIFDNLSSGKKVNINLKAKFYWSDITDKKAVDDIFRKEAADVVIHLAAQIDVRKSVEDPRYDAGINILGSLNVLDACVKNKVKKVIFASSGGTIYGECASKAPDEKSFPNPLSPYGIAKYSVENYIKFFSAIHNLKYTILRYSNVYGPRQDPKGEAGVVAIFAGKILANEPVFVYGDGKQLRDYVFVLDVVNANIKALTKGDNQTINIGTQKTTSVNDLAKVMSKSSLNYTQSPVYKPARDGELFKSFLNISKAKKELGWQPKVNIKDGIKETLKYFKKINAENK
ncbi:NAD-dependent epimerase/dehydratase family protein [Endomicrobium proavitum]|uniref:Putative UDP-glucose 4-epimerase n=1 Tax=Endomicrobium proavitum TaxID=1408281 RepID=A0A0G3WHF2_9BACT|nr:NAD-dependent epimerase/dehydratase family protein [Endomicrobium proavitum]AKL97758.1 putative UDP-glucose 4-epimerase [Endomicrobium proavitum]